MGDRGGCGCNNGDCGCDRGDRFGERGDCACAIDVRRGDTGGVSNRTFRMGLLCTKSLLRGDAARPLICAPLAVPRRWRCHAYTAPQAPRANPRGSAPQKGPPPSIAAMELSLRWPAPTPGGGEGLSLAEAPPAPLPEGGALPEREGEGDA